MKRKYFILCLMSTAVFAIAMRSMQNEKVLFEKGGIRISGLTGTPAFAEAAILLSAPANGSSIPEGKDTFDFEVKNYVLGAQTPDAAGTLCANSAKGQHIHFIMDNSPYAASYTSRFVSEMKPGHHVLLAFLSRSYHESLKHQSAYTLKEFNVGKGAKDEFDERASHLFFSRPKGEYLGEGETAKVLLDFYLVNCTLSAKGYKVRATINGNQFLFTEWIPYVIEGLPIGESKIKLELLDARGQLVKSPFNGAERTFTLKNTQ